MSHIEVDRESFEREHREWFNSLPAIERAERGLEHWFDTLPRAAYREGIRWGLITLLETAEMVHEADPDPELSLDQRKREWIRDWLRSADPKNGRIALDLLDHDWLTDSGEDQT